MHRNTFRIGVVRFPGTNCDQDTFDAVQIISRFEPVWVSYESTSLPNLDAVILPGGFSYGDYLRTGAISAQAPVINAIRTFAEEGKPVLGICNGFQILVEAKLLPGALLVNSSRSFICEETPLLVQSSETPFSRLLAEGSRISLPIAHQEGRYFLPESALRELEQNRQVIFRYLSNPNGSVNDIAGVSNRSGNVVGFMPHPERRMHSSTTGSDGLLIFESLLTSLLHLDPVSENAKPTELSWANSRG
ncbi:MAG: phosphoribosylformylglycinamidine synthase subunit PurQ [Leptospirales bacterium]